jgi:hypothetical protein
MGTKVMPMKSIGKTSSFHMHGSRGELYEAGKALRETCPRKTHAAWKALPGRPDPVQLVLEAEKGRMPDLLPLRHGRAWCGRRLLSTAGRPSPWRLT